MSVAGGEYRWRDRLRDNEISGTDDDVVFQTWRQDNATYTLPITPGNYTVTLSFAETYYNNPGQRVFHVDIGEITVSGIDIISEVGKNAAYSMTVPVTVPEGATELVIQTTGVTHAAVIGAIVVREAE